MASRKPRPPKKLFVMMWRGYRPCSTSPCETAKEAKSEAARWAENSGNPNEYTFVEYIPAPPKKRSKRNARKAK